MKKTTSAILSIIMLVALVMNMFPVVSVGAANLKYPDGATIQQLESDELFFGEFQTSNFTFNGVSYSTYPLGAIVTYNGVYYENKVEGTAAWGDGWEPDAHSNWSEITIISSGSSQVSSISIDLETTQIKTGATRNLTATVDPSDTAVTWSSSDTSIATVDANGVLKCVGSGGVTITVSAGDKSDSCYLQVGISPRGAADYSVWTVEDTTVYSLQFGTAYCDTVVTNINGRMYIPLRAAMTAIGTEEMTYNNGVVTFKNQYGSTVEIEIDSTKAKVEFENGDVHEADLIAAPTIYNNRTYLPARDLAFLSGYSIEYITTADNDYFVFSNDDFESYTAQGAIEEVVGEIEIIDTETIITLLGDTVEITGTGAVFSDGVVTITEGKTYTVIGTLNDGQLLVDCADEVTLLLKGVNIQSTVGSAIYGIGGDIVIETAAGTENFLTDAALYTNTASDAALYNEGNLTFKGTGSLEVTGSSLYGISSKGETTITEGTITVNSFGDAIRGKSALTITGGTVTATSDDGDAIKSTKGAVTINCDTAQTIISTTAEADAIQAETSIIIEDGKLNIFGKRGMTAVTSIEITGGEVVSSSREVYNSDIITTTDGAIYLNYLTEAISKGTQIVVSEGTQTIAELAPTKKFTYVFITNPLIESGKTYKVTTGGEQMTHDTAVVEGEFVTTDNATTFNAVTAITGGEVVLDPGIYLENDSITVVGEGVELTSTTVATVTAPGVYDVYGTLDDGRIIVNVDKTLYPLGEVELVLNGVTMSCSTNSTIYVASIDGECAISAKKGTVNEISDGVGYINEDEDVGAIYSKDDLKIKGKGTLIVNGNTSFGIVSKDDLKLYNGTITVNSVGTSIKGRDSVRIGNPADTDFSSLIVTATSESGDGIKTTNIDDPEKGYIVVNGGTINVNTYSDAFQASLDFIVNGGTIDIYTYEGSTYKGTVNSGTWGGMQEGNTNSTDISAKGLKSDGTLTVNGGTITIDSTDDALHSTGDMTILGGTLEVASADDAFHSDTILTVGGGYINVTYSYEGLEAEQVIVNDGEIHIYATDDGVNAAGGTDGSGNNVGPGFGQGGPGGNQGNPGTVNTNAKIEINGGYLFVNADGDGIDSNNTLTFNGGVTIVSGPVGGGNGSIDADGIRAINGGILMALSYQGMMEYPSSNYIYSTSLGASANTVISVVDASGNVLTAFKTPKSVSDIIYSNSSTTLSSCSVYRGGTYSGTFNQDGYAAGGTITGGTRVNTTVR